MDLTLLGTGSADGWPNPFCGCASCASERRAGRVRGQTSALLDGVLLLDCGPETPRAAERAGVDLTALRHVLITHAHPDHCSPAFLLFRSWVGEAPLDVLGPPDVIEACRMWVAPDSPVNFVAVRPGDRITLSSYDVSVLPAAHGSRASAVLYDVTGPTGRLLYATDTGPLPAAVLDAVRDARFGVVLLEETFGDHTTHGTDHLDLVTFPEQVRRLRQVGAATEDTDVIAVHLSHHNPPTDELDRRLAGWGARTVEDGSRLGAAWPPSPAQRVMVIGGARSGKSHEAERLLAAELDVTYVATAYPAGEDPEWDERIRRHEAGRPAHWRTVETVDLVGLLRGQGGPLLVDCLTLWLTRLLDSCNGWDDDAWASTGEKTVQAAVDELVAALRVTSRRVVLVTNEVGQGIVPDTASGRRFRDLMGRLNAQVARQSDDVRWCVAGRVVRL